KRANKSQAEMLAAIGFKRTTVSNWEGDTSTPSVDDLVKIAKYLGVTETDLLHTDLEAAGNLIENPKSEDLQANGNLTRKGNSNLLPIIEGVKRVASEAETPAYSASKMPKVITLDTQGNENVVMVPVKARAGYLNGYADPKFIGKLPAYRLPGLNNGTFRLFEVGGRSMYPTLHDGDMVIGSFVEQLRDVRDDRLYVIVTKSEGVVVKRVLNRLENDGKLILKSDNYKDRDEFPTMVVDPQDILEIWYVTGFISRQMRPPAEMYNRLIDLEGRLTLMEEQNRKRLKEN
ncbi:MAG TPA: LexA family transcriptional regulator, partial [Lentimicrobium sp.]|nr:LexA family transcriptional regulator [Lentimicrobium sp.]